MATKKKTGLGKGLDALFADLPTVDISTPEPVDTGDGNRENVVNIGIDNVMPNKSQPRKTFDSEALADLANSIAEHGIIQPIIVRPQGQGYEIVAGERRYRAARQAGLTEVPCIVRDLSDRENMLFAIVENMQREDLNPIEEAEGLAAMIDTYHLTQEQVSLSVGKSRPYIANAIRLLGLSPQVLELVRAGELSAGHGRTLLQVADSKKQERLADKCIKEGWSVRALEHALAGPKPRRKAGTKAKDPDVVAVENELKEIFGTKVNLVRKGPKGDKGHIEIEYYSAEELERLIDLLRQKG